MSDDPFIKHRSLLFTVAYGMLGSAADAEDVVQESWLRWADIDHAVVRDPRAYLVRIVTRQSLNRLRTVARLREDYVGPWLPEPLLTSPDLADDIELAESVSIAMLTVLEALNPIERAVFVLREVFDVRYNEIAAAVGKTSATVRQIARRARQRVAARRPRVKVSRAEQEQVVERFLAALTTDDVQGLMDVLAPEVVILADGGGLARADKHPVEGRERAVAFLRAQVTTLLINGGLARADKHPVEGRERVVAFLRAQVTTLLINGALAARIGVTGGDQGVVSFVVEEGRIARIYGINNPHKLGRLERITDLQR